MTTLFPELMEKVANLNKEAGLPVHVLRGGGGAYGKLLRTRRAAGKRVAKLEPRLGLDQDIKKLIQRAADLNQHAKGLVRRPDAYLAPLKGSRVSVTSAKPTEIQVNRFRDSLIRDRKWYLGTSRRNPGSLKTLADAERALKP